MFAHINTTDNTVICLDDRNELLTDHPDVILVEVPADAVVSLGYVYKTSANTFSKPDSEKTLEDWRAQKNEELAAAYNAAFTTFTSNALGNTKTYPITQEAQDDLKDLQNRLIADPNKNSFYFLTMDDGILINHTRVQFLQLLSDAEARTVAIHNQNRTYANQISSSTSIPTLQAMTFTFS